MRYSPKLIAPYLCKEASEIADVRYKEIKIDSIGKIF